jgi:hypothetical protein
MKIPESVLARTARQDSIYIEELQQRIKVFNILLANGGRVPLVIDKAHESSLLSRCNIVDVHEYISARLAKPTKTFHAAILLLERS